MKALMVIDSGALCRQIADTLNPIGFNCIQYRNPVKAFCNLDEIGADAVFISTRDFPRHWKILCWYINSAKKEHQTAAFLLRGPLFVMSDAEKAVSLGIQAIIDEDTFSKNGKGVLNKLFAHFQLSGGDDSNNQNISSEMVFMFVHPVRKSIVTGTTEALHEDRIVFRPDILSTTITLKEGILLNECTFKKNGIIYTFCCRILKNTDKLILQIEKSINGNIK